MLTAHFSKIVLKYSNEVHLLRYLTPLDFDDFATPARRHTVENGIFSVFPTQYFIVAQQWRWLGKKWENVGKLESPDRQKGYLIMLPSTTRTTTRLNVFSLYDC
jgi:hypothetical protein